MSSYRSCKNLWKSCVEHHTFFCLQNQNVQLAGEQRNNVNANNGQIPKASNRYNTQHEPHIASNLARSEAFRQDFQAPFSNNVSMNASFPGPTNGPTQHPVAGRTSGQGTRESRGAWNKSPNIDPSGGFHNRRQFHTKDSVYVRYQEVSSDEEDTGARKQLHTIETLSPVIVTLPKLQNINPNSKTNDHSSKNKTGVERNADCKYEGLVTIRMQPDENARFGFNVKGGSDQSQPIVVSRVAPNSPADKCFPRLSQGDHVLFINGRDVSQHTHAQVVEFIRAARESHSGELELIIRQNVYLNDGSPSEPDFQYIPDTQHMVAVLAPGGDALTASFNLLRELVDSNAGAAQFEQLYRKKAGYTFNISQELENINKNRYRDILPYDQTRVKLKTTENDYINANYINMEIPGSGIINSYIACQGPLPETCADFWAMTWEQRSSLVVMLTMVSERGRVKCHQYWPDVGTMAIYGNYSVTCCSEEVTQSFAFRNLKISSLLERDSTERLVYQMQYLAWPDHGVPDDATDFLSFIALVRKHRAGVVEPTIIHCSAGIGRTGVLIAMETCMCMIEAGQPLHMLDVVRQMRDQRAMLIQTTGQYTFVCEAVLKVYDERIVVPLEEYTHR